MVKLCSAGIALAALLTSCTHGETPQQPAPPENLDHSTVHWMPTQAVDLMSTEGTFIRALMESFAAAQTTTGDPTTALRVGGYPGFEHALNNSQKVDEVFGTTPSRGISVGADYREVVSLTKQGDRFKAGVCRYYSRTADQTPDGRYKSSVLIGSGAWLTFGPDPKLSAQEQHSPPPNQKGTANRPVDNVFGSWIVFEYNPLVEPTLNCDKLAPGTPKDFHPGEYEEVPLTLPPDPGWPEGSKA